MSLSQRQTDFINKLYILIDGIPSLLGMTESIVHSRRVRFAWSQALLWNEISIDISFCLLTTEDFFTEIGDLFQNKRLILK